MNIIQGFPTPQKDFYKVYVRSITYNQASYIEDCLNGVAMQETNFHFIHHVIDDASTDGEQDVIKAWMDKNCDMENAEYYDNGICTIILAKNKKNPNCTLITYLLKKNMYGNPKKVNLYTPWREVCPYEALCEGDDYWIDKTKIQKQLDLLEANPDIGLCYTQAKTYNQSSNKFTNVLGCNITNGFYQLVKGNVIPTVTALFRQEANQNYIKEVEPYKKGWLMGDYPLWLYISLHYKIEFIPECTSIYRVLNESASHSIDLKKQISFEKSVLNIRNYFLDQIKNGDKLKEEVLVLFHDIIFNLALSKNEAKVVSEHLNWKIGFLMGKIDELEKENANYKDCHNLYSSKIKFLNRIICMNIVVIILTLLIYIYF